MRWCMWANKLPLYQTPCGHVAGCVLLYIRRSFSESIFSSLCIILPTTHKYKYYLTVCISIIIKLGRYMWALEALMKLVSRDYRSRSWITYPTGMNWLCDRSQEVKNFMIGSKSTSSTSQVLKWELSEEFRMNNMNTSFSLWSSSHFREYYQ